MIKFLENRTVLSFDVESIGLHGEAYAVGYVILLNGEEIDCGRFACSPEKASGTPEDRAWVQANCPPIECNATTPKQVRDLFWRKWMQWKPNNVVLAADCSWPVEANFLSACVRDSSEERKWEGPYPLIDIGSVTMTSGGNPLETFERLPNELPVHDPLADARQSARLMVQALAAMKDRNCNGQSVVTCVYCGHEYPDGTQTQKAQLLTDHIKVCEKHPMRAAEARILCLRQALEGLVDASTKEELEGMEMVMRAIPAPESDKAAAINAIHALLDELKVEAPQKPQSGFNCPHCQSVLLFSYERGPHCDGCDEFDVNEII